MVYLIWTFLIVVVYSSKWGVVGQKCQVKWCQVSAAGVASRWQVCSHEYSVSGASAMNYDLWEVCNHAVIVYIYCIVVSLVGAL